MAVHKRNTKMDVLRSICMLEIVAYWHIGDYFGFWPGSTIFSIGLTLTMGTLAMFTYISGYLSPYDGNIKSFFKNRIKFIPSFVIAYMLMSYIGYFPLKDIGSILTIIGLKEICPPPYPATLWYISMIFFFYIITPLIVKDTLRKTIMFSSCVFSVLIILNNIWGIDTRIYYYFPFYVLGIVNKRFEKFQMLSNHDRLLLITALLATLSFDNNTTDLSLISGFARAICSFIIINNLANWLDKFNRMRCVFYTLSICSTYAYMYHRVIYHFVLRVFHFHFIVEYIIMLTSLFCFSFISQYIYKRLSLFLKTFFSIN